jgi:hypothetical protein
VADVAVIDVATGRGVGGTVVVDVVEVVEGTVVVVTIGARVVVVDVVEVVEGTVVVVTIGARVVVVPVTIGATVVVVTTETAGAVVVVTADGATVVEVEAIVVVVVVVVVVVDSGALSEASSKKGVALTFVGATGGNLIVKSVCPFAHFVRILTANTLVRL